MSPHTEALRDQACLIVHGPDQPGLVAAVTALIARNAGNIVTLDQYSDNPEGGAFFQRGAVSAAIDRGLQPVDEARNCARLNAAC